METAYRMQSEAMDVFDLRKEPEAVREEYGTTPFANGCLLARRLVERGVRYRPRLLRPRPALGRPQRHQQEPARAAAPTWTRRRRR